MSTNLIAVIFPASRAAKDTSWQQNLEIENFIFQMVRTESDTEPDNKWPFHSRSRNLRTQDLLTAIRSNKYDAVIAGRGGYGCSDLLDEIPWDEFATLPPKLLIGFSDISALHSAFYSKLQWPSIHAPMPFASYPFDPHSRDVRNLLKLLSDYAFEASVNSSQQWGSFPTDRSLLFGGCFSVLTNLIGTTYMPNLDDHIVYFEDINEHPAKILRNLNQWSHSGVLQNAKGIIIGSFTGLDEFGFDKSDICEEFHQRLNLPILSSEDFGHCFPNMPIGIGFLGQYADNRLTWSRGWSSDPQNNPNV